MIRTIAAIATLSVLSACSGGPGTEQWCEEKKAQSKSEWSGEDAKTFAKNCLLDSTTIGSEAWCEKMKEKESDELSVEEAKDFAKHCVI